jgi:predicted dithiol-disulfide oxidoreductase (DUF899 family)
MTKHRIGTREEWLKARLALLEQERALTHQGDEVARRRQELPWVAVDKDYAFDTETGRATLADLFRGRSQLLVYHFMFGPDFSAGCPSCTSIADGFNGFADHLAHHDVMLWAVSRAPLSKLMAFRRRMGWSFPWASSHDGEFNADFSASFTAEQQSAGLEYNYSREAPMQVAPVSRKVTNWRSVSGENPVEQVAAMAGTDVATFLRERPGMSAFVREGDVVYHTYSTFARGLDGLWGLYAWLDRAPRGRNETGFWLRHRDDYGAGGAAGAAPDCCSSAGKAR